MNIDLHYNKKKVFLSEKIVPWEHEQFSKKKILTSTLSGRKTPVESLFDAKPVIDTKLDEKTLKKNIKYIIESLFSILFEVDNIDIFKNDETVIDELNIKTLVSFFQKYPRGPLNVVKNSQVNNDLHTIMSTYLTKVQRQVFEYKDTKFYDSNSGIIRVYTVKSKMIDLYLLGCIVLYLTLLYIYAKGVKNFFSNFKNFFSDE
jgi:hypothetical protein